MYNYRLLFVVEFSEFYFGQQDGDAAVGKRGCASGSLDQRGFQGEQVAAVVMLAQQSRLLEKKKND